MSCSDEIYSWLKKTSPKWAETARKHPYMVTGTAAGPQCDNCGRGFQCWHAPDDSPCVCEGKTLEIKDGKVKLVEYAFDVPGVISFGSTEEAKKAKAVIEEALTFAAKR